MQNSTQGTQKNMQNTQNNMQGMQKNARNSPQNDMQGMQKNARNSPQNDMQGMQKNAPSTRNNMQKEGSTAGFVLSLIGGILGILAGIAVILQYMVFNWAGGFLGEDISGFLTIFILTLAGIALVTGIIIMISSFWMRKNASLKKGAITSLVLGILSLNLFAIIGGIVGLVSLSKKSL